MTMYVMTKITSQLIKQQQFNVKTKTNIPNHIYTNSIIDIVGETNMWNALATRRKTAMQRPSKLQKYPNRPQLSPQ